MRRCHLQFFRVLQVFSGVILISCSPQLLTNPTAKNQQNQQNLQKTVLAPSLALPDPEYSRAFGMRNLGNTCFANSLHKLLWQYLGKDLNFLLQANSSLADHFYTLMQGLNQNEDCLLQGDVATCNNSTNFRSELELYIRDFKRVNREFYPRSGDNISYFYPSVFRLNQVDVLDYFIKLDEFLKLSFITPSKSFFLTQQSVFENHRNEPTTEKVASSDVAGTQQNKPYIIFEVGINHIDVTSVSEAITQYFKPELMTGVNQLRNDATGVDEDGRIERYLTVPNAESIPQKIMIALKREHRDPLTGRAEKVLKPIVISKLIKVKFSLPDLTLAKKQSYHLKAVLVHSGSDYRSGHYYSYILDQEGKWIEHNDANVFTLTKKSEVNAAKKT